MKRLAELDKINLEAVVAHLIALMLVSGFLGLGTIAMMGLVKLSDPTTSAFAGTLLGYAIVRVEHAMTRYFGANPNSQEKTNATPE